MADNTTLPVSGGGTEVFANDDIGGVKYPRAKLTWGPDGTSNDTDVASGKPMPVQLRGSDGTDRSNVLPVTVSSGTITAVTSLTNALPAGTNAIGKLAANSGVDIGDVDITSIAAGDNNIGNVDIASIAAGDNNIGNVDIASAIPAGNNNIGDVDIASIAAGDNNIGNVDIASIAAGDNNIGNVDVLSVVPGVAATSLGKAEDAAHTSGDVGVMVLGVRQDTQTAFGADGDYVPPSMDASGNLRVALATTQLSSILDVSASVTRPANTTAYTANDAMSDSTTAPTAGGMTFSAAAAATDGGGIITDIVVVSTKPDGTPLQGELWLFDSAPTAINDADPFLLSDAHALLCVGIIPFTLAIGATNNAIAHISGVNLTYRCNGTDDLRGLVKVINAYVPANAEVVTFRLKGIRA